MTGQWQIPPAYLGSYQFLFMGYCIGGCFALKLMERAPERVMAGVLVQTVGHHPEHPDYMFNSGRDVWAVVSQFEIDR